MKVNCAIFYKDFKVIGKQALVALAFQMLLLLVIPLIKQSIDNQLNAAEMTFKDWFPKVQIAISIIIALLAACYFSVEERVGKHDWFLRRLPISRTRLYVEKLFAGVLIIVGVSAIQYLWYLSFLTFGIELWYFDDIKFQFILISSVLAYIIALPLSMIFKQSIGVILVGLGITYSLMWYWSLTEGATQSSWKVISIAILIILAVSTTIIMLAYRSGSSLPTPRISQLLKKEWREARFTTLFAFLFLMITTFMIIVPYNLTLVMIVCSFSVVISIIAGITTYAQDEKNGTRCVIYQHPIPITQIFWAKFICGLFPASLSALSFSLISSSALLHYVNSTSELQFVQIAATTEVFSMHLFLFLLGLLPYCCAVLATHIIPNQLSAFMESFFITAIAIAALYYLQFHNFILIFLAKSMLPFSYSFTGYQFFSTIPWILIGMLVVLTLAAWWVASDRDTLSTTVWKRHLNVIRIFAFSLALMFLLVRTGWKDLFYLITGTDIGVG